MQYSLSGIKPGDTVTVTRRRFTGIGVEELTVTRVGRRYFYVARGYGEQQFEIGTGVEKVDYGPADRAYTAEQYADHLARTATLKALNEAGLTLTRSWNNPFTTAQLTAILAVVQP